jgi:2-keto-3-deoxy-L-rhamnonate aldolase RhmA
MESVRSFIAKINNGGVCLGTGITFTDPTATEALCDLFDFVWIDMEHNALSLEAVQGHLMATKASRTVPLVRVPANDPTMIKRVLDIGAAGVIVPMIRTAQEAALAVQDAATRHRDSEESVHAGRRTMDVHSGLISSKMPMRTF